MSQLAAVTDQTFQSEVLDAAEVVLVDFWAEWCGPCKMIAPILDEVAAELGDSVKMLKLNVDENPDTPVKYAVRGIPTILIFKGGEVVDTKVGAASKSQLIEFIRKHTA